MLNLKAREQGRVFFVKLNAIDHVGHHVAHKLTRLLVDTFRIHENFSDIGLKVIADRANHKIAFFDNKEGGGIGAL